MCQRKVRFAHTRRCRFNVSLLFHYCFFFFTLDVCALNAFNVALMLESIVMMFLSLLFAIITTKYSHITRSSIVLWWRHFQWFHFHLLCFLLSFFCLSSYFFGYLTRMFRCNHCINLFVIEITVMFSQTTITKKNNEQQQQPRWRWW